MNIFLDDSACRKSLFPFTHTRHTADTRLGMLTLREKWERISGYRVYTSPQNLPQDCVRIPANIIPTTENINSIITHCIAGENLLPAEGIKVLAHPWEIFMLNDWALRQDFALLTAGKKSAPLPQSATIINAAQVFVEEGAKLEHTIINACAGPVYISAGAEIMEGSMIRGPFFAGSHALVKMGAKIYGASSIGPYCIAGGEIKNSMMFGYSNKAHDGYLGDSVIGEWCNLGAGTSNSNIKNTAGPVQYLEDAAAPVHAGTKAGLLMADYSRCAINTAFNTGTIVGVCCNIFGEAPAKYVPHFSWGKERYILAKAIEDIGRWKQLKGAAITEAEQHTLTALYHSTI